LISEVVQVKVFGDQACFTRPELGTERVSYEVMTPSAARGILEAIFWKPEIKWCVREIQVLSLVRRVGIVRNEISDSQRPGQRYVADRGREDGGKRMQRHTLFLRDVSYFIKAQITTEQENTVKYLDQFRRRVRKGQCFRQPVFGMRECVAYFEPPDGSEMPLEDLSTDLGLMFGGYDYDKGPPEPRFFRARLDGGILRVPEAVAS
jgi:CRISPR-associated protein Cas5d